MTGSNSPESTAHKGRHLFDLIKEDHARMEYLTKEFDRPDLAPENRLKIAWAAIRGVVIHASQEEETLYPAIRDKMGVEEADKLLADDQHLRKLAAELGRLSKTDISKDSEQAFQAAFHKFAEVNNSHQLEEEQAWFPRFAAIEGVDEEYLCNLGAKYVAAKSWANTRPHWWAPVKPPLASIAHHLTWPVDAVMDLWRFGLKYPEIDVQHIQGVKTSDEVCSTNPQ